MRKLAILAWMISPSLCFCQQTPFEKSAGRQTATYRECIDYYKELDKSSSRILIREMGKSDAGYPFDLVLYSNDGKFDPQQWHKQHKVVILINNGIHPGEPDRSRCRTMLYLQ
jgi:hypothetical protein